MAKIRIAAYIERGSVVVRVNDVEVVSGGGTYEGDVRPGSHVLQWYVASLSGTSYSISVSSPGEAEFQLTRKLGRTGKDFGGFEFEEK